MARTGKRKRKDPDSDCSSIEAEAEGKSTMQLKRPMGPYMHYYIQQCRSKDPSMKMTDEAKRVIHAEYEALPQEEKQPFIDMTERQKEEYKLLKLRLSEEGGNEKLTINTRCSPIQLAKFIRYLKDSKKDNVLRDIGFGSLVHLKARRLRRDLCRYLVENFDVRGRCMQFEGHRIPLTVKDVAAMLGIKNEGDDVDEVLKGTNWSKLLVRHGIDKNIKFPQLEDRMKSLEADSVEMKACLLMYVVGVLLCPTSSVSPNEKYFNCLCERGLTGNLNWAQHVHAYLIRGMESYLESDRNHGYLNGCVLLLEAIHLQ